jgi:hypothetical protein
VSDVKHRTSWHRGGALLVGLFLAACNTPTDSTAPNTQQATSAATVRELADQTARVHESNQVLGLQVAARGLGTQGLGARSYTAQPWQFQVVASIDSPKVQALGETEALSVQATHIAFRDKYMFVSYGFRGDKMLGALDVFELSETQAAPRLLTSIAFQDMDANAVTVDRFGKVLVIGNRQPGKWSGTGRPVAMVQLSPKWNDAQWQAEFFKNAQGQIDAPTFEMPGWSGNDIVNFGPMAIVSAGNESCYVRPDAPLDTGGVSFVTNGTSNPHQSKVGLEVFDAFCNAQAMGLSARSGAMATLKGGLQGELKIYALNTKALTATEMAKTSTFKSKFEVGPVGTLGGKNRIDVHGNLIWVALGESEVKAFRADGSSSVPVYSLDTRDAAGRNEDWMANGTTIADGLIYAAYGAGGLHVAQLPAEAASPDCACDAVQARTVADPPVTINVPWNGWLDLGGSANFVESHGNLIFVANGGGGLKVIKRL